MFNATTSTGTTSSSPAFLSGILSTSSKALDNSNTTPGLRAANVINDVNRFTPFLRTGDIKFQTYQNIGNNGNRVLQAVGGAGSLSKALRSSDSRSDVVVATNDSGQEVALSHDAAKELKEKADHSSAVLKKLKEQEHSLGSVVATSEGGGVEGGKDSGKKDSGGKKQVDSKALAEASAKFDAIQAERQAAEQTNQTEATQEQERAADQPQQAAQTNNSVEPETQTVTQNQQQLGQTQDSTVINNLDSQNQAPQPVQAQAQQTTSTTALNNLNQNQSTSGVPLHQDTNAGFQNSHTEVSAGDRSGGPRNITIGSGSSVASSVSGAVHKAEVGAAQRITRAPGQLVEGTKNALGIGDNENQAGTQVAGRSRGGVAKQPEVMLSPNSGMSSSGSMGGGGDDGGDGDDGVSAGTDDGNDEPEKKEDGPFKRAYKRARNKILKKGAKGFFRWAGKGLMNILRFLFTNPIGWIILAIIIIIILLIVIIPALTSSTNEAVEEQNTQGLVTEFFDYIGISGGRNGVGPVTRWDVDTVTFKGADLVDKLTLQFGFKLKDEATYNKDFFGDPQLGIVVKDMELCAEIMIPDGYDIGKTEYWGENFGTFQGNNPTIENKGRKVCWQPYSCNETLGPRRISGGGCRSGIEDLSTITLSELKINGADVPRQMPQFKVLLSGKLMLQNKKEKEKTVEYFIKPPVSRCLDINNLTFQRCPDEALPDDVAIVVDNDGNTGTPQFPGGTIPQGAQCPIYKTPGRIIYRTNGYAGGGSHQANDIAEANTPDIYTHPVVAPISGYISYVMPRADYTLKCGHALIIQECQEFVGNSCSKNGSMAIFLTHVKPTFDWTVNTKVTAGQTIGSYYPGIVTSCWSGPHIHVELYASGVTSWSSTSGLPEITNFIERTCTPGR